ncbi:hypothetical protein SAMN05444354_11410 [Stigmatella aurantiaca]|uniref:Uncharacterized protein n=1 Tax=Stigmatella aurantiaca TaxID=41 RepID=A0A1H7WY85_STIAU|nr:hypothetical protein SAMN05444354_11410 [Stigmatella aurantiaca]
MALTVVCPGLVETNIVRPGRAVSDAQRKAEAHFITGRAIPAEQVVRRVVQGIQSQSAQVLVGLDYHLVDWMARLSPWLSQVVTARLSQRMPLLDRAPQKSRMRSASSACSTNWFTLPCSSEMRRLRATSAASTVSSVFHWRSTASSSLGMALLYSAEK